MWSLKMKDYWIKITSIHKDHENRSAKIEFSTSAKGIMKEDHFHIAYKESQASGMEGVLTQVDIFSNHVVLNRSGDITQKMEFEIGVIKYFEYETLYGKLLFKLNTQKVKIERDEGMVRLVELIYELLNSDDQCMGNYRLSLLIQEAKG